VGDLVRRDFLGKLAGLFVAPWLKPTPTPVLDWIPDDSTLIPIIPPLVPEKGETLYFLDTKYFHLPCHPMPRANAIITDLRDPYEDFEMGEPLPIRTTNGLTLLSEEASLKREMRITKIDHEKKAITYGFKEGL
jgi:hypothetical protein